MCDSKKTKKELTEELQHLRSHVAELEKVQAHHKKTEGKLKQYQFMVESAYDAIFSKDLKSRYIIANSKTLEDFGLSRAQVIGKNDYEIMPNKEEARKNIEDDRLVLKTGKLTEISKHMTGTDGKERWFQAVKVPQFDDNGNIVGLVGIARDITEHKKAEEVLRDKTRALDAIITNLKQGIAYLDENDTIIYLNQQCADLFGLKYEDVFQRNIYGFHSPKKRGAVRALIKEFKEGRQYFNVVETIDNKVIDNTFHRIQDGDGNYQGILMSAVDITERKHAEEALRESEERFRNLMDFIPGVSIQGYDLDGTVFYWNKASEKVYGYTAEEAMGRNLGELIIPPDVKPHFEKALEAGRTIESSGEFLPPGELMLLHKKGHLVPVYSIHTAVNIEGRKPLLFCIDLDLSERKRVEEELREARDELEIRVEQRTAELAGANEELRNENIERKRTEEELRIARDDWKNIFESISDGVLILDRSHHILDANRATVATLRRPKDEIIGRFCYELFHCAEHPPDQCPHEKLLSSEHPETVDMEMEVFNGVYLVTVAPILDREGKVVKTIHIAKDITERKRAEEKLHIYQKQLRSLASELSLAEERMRRRIATDVHDHISQNLAISKIKLESLGEFAFLSEPGKTLNEVRDLIAQTIESARSLTFELSPPVLYELGFESAVVWLIRQTRRQYGLSTEFKDDKQPKPLNHNVRVLLFQAVRELLVNVAKHAQARNVTVSARRVRDEIHVSVEDDGVGFDVSRADSRAYETGGFGLFSIRERLGHIGGRLNIESRPGHGTRVTLTAPIDRQDKTSEEKRK